MGIDHILETWCCVCPDQVMPCVSQYAETANSCRDLLAQSGTPIEEDTDGSILLHDINAPKAIL